jgi:ATP-dependent Lon protease
MTTLSDINKKKGVPIKNPKKRKKYSKDEDSEPLNLVFTFKTNESKEKNKDEDHYESDQYDSSEYDSSEYDSDDESEESEKPYVNINDIQYLNNEHYKNIMNSIHKNIEDVKEHQYKDFIGLSTKHKEVSLSDYDYFISLSIEKQKELLLSLKEINDININDNIPTRFKIIDLPISNEYKFIIMSKFNQLSSIMPFDPVYNKLKHWVDSCLSIPFNQYSYLPVTIKDGIHECQLYMDNAKKILDDTVYGLNDVKFQIMQFIGKLITNPSSIGNAIAIEGPMGTGKTTIIKEGISKILNRPFELISLGGATDSCLLQGHSYTYEGSMYGKIIEILIKTKCMNPIIYFDELDKVSDTPKGHEIIGVLTHLIDSSQNDKFHDRYFSGLEFDVSKCLFMFSYNDKSLVNPILRDRMYTITIDGYSSKDKLVIANQYLIPSVSKHIHLDDIIIPDESIQYIIDNFNQDKGVRNLKRCIEIIYSKINLYRLMKPTDKLFGEDYIVIHSPFIVTVDIIQKLIKKNKEKTYYNLYL